MYTTMKGQLTVALDEIREAGTMKGERPLASSQSALVTAGGSQVLNFCANNS